MNIPKRRVVKIEESRRVIPEGSSGTGYSQYRILNVTFDRFIEENEQICYSVWIEDWYNNDQWQQFEKQLNWTKTGIDITNWNEVYDMFNEVMKHI